MPSKIRKAADGGYFYRIEGRNGEPLAHSETYTRREDAVRSWKALMETILRDFGEQLTSGAKGMNGDEAIVAELLGKMLSGVEVGEPE